MSCADQRFFTKEHIATHGFDAPDALAEQAIHCLELVAELSDAGLQYQFKGGNSLLLILDSPRRFSIDVDIATDEPRERIEQILEKIVAQHGVFTRWTHRPHKTKPWIPIASYYLFYNAHFAEPDNAYIMLDVQLRRSPYKTAMKPVVCGDIFVSGILTDLPLPASIIGDKLLTLGPYTLGIPVGKNKEAQRLKHVYDVSTLLGTAPLLDDIRESFFACMEHENSLQEKKSGEDEVLEDTLIYCYSVAKSLVPPPITSDASPVLKENIVGLEPFAGHLFSKHYTWTMLQRDMARTAACIAAVCTAKVTAGILTDALSLADSGKTSPAIPELQCGADVQYLWNCVREWRGSLPG